MRKETADEKKDSKTLFSLFHPLEEQHSVMEGDSVVDV